MLRGHIVGALWTLLFLAACAKTYGPSSGDSGPVLAGPGEAVVVTGFDLVAGGSGLGLLAAEDAGSYRLAFHAYDPTTQRLLDPPRAFYVEQSCAGAAPGQRVCAAAAHHAAVAVPAGDYILAFVLKQHVGTYVPNLFGYGGTTHGSYATLLSAVDVVTTGNVAGSFAAAPGASVEGNKAPRFHVAAGENLYIGFIEIQGAVWTRETVSGKAGVTWGKADLYTAIESRPDQARAALAKAGLDATTLVERPATAEKP